MLTVNIGTESLLFHAIWSLIYSQSCQAKSQELDTVAFKFHVMKFLVIHEQAIKL